MRRLEAEELRAVPRVATASMLTAATFYDIISPKLMRRLEAEEQKEIPPRRRRVASRTPIILYLTPSKCQIRGEKQYGNAPRPIRLPTPGTRGLIGVGHGRRDNGARGSASPAGHPATESLGRK